MTSDKNELVFFLSLVTPQYYYSPNARNVVQKIDFGSQATGARGGMIKCTCLSALAAASYNIKTLP